MMYGAVLTETRQDVPHHVELRCMRNCWDRRLFASNSSCLQRFTHRNSDDLYRSLASAATVQCQQRSIKDRIISAAHMACQSPLDNAQLAGCCGNGLLAILVSNEQKPCLSVRATQLDPSLPGHALHFKHLLHTRL